jgi:short-chain fatty acids transporter
VLLFFKKEVLSSLFPSFRYNKPNQETNAMSEQTPLGRITNVFVYLFERLLPDPFVFAIILSLITAGLALALAPHGAPAEVLTAWYNGLFQIFPFAFQMVLVLVTGYALSASRPVARGLSALAALPRSAAQAVALAMVVSMAANLLNWGFGLVVSALFARELAKRHRLDFAWLVAAAYAGFLMFPPGLSSSIALAEATPGSALNITQKITGQIVPLGETLLPWFNILPVLVLFAVLPLLFTLMRPAEAHAVFAESARLVAEDAAKPAPPVVGGLAGLLDRAWILNVALVAAAAAYFARAIWLGTFHLDINGLILIFLALGLLLHWRPVVYAEAVQNAARVTGPLLLQYPLYGGIMGIMTATGLAGVIAKGFIVVSTPHTLPFWGFISSIVISLFVPSGGGHWAVQGPFIVPAAAALHVSQGLAAMSVAYGEGVANMIQPFWALPLLAIAGLGMRRMMGFSVVSFVVALVVFGAAMLVFA